MKNTPMGALLSCFKEALTSRGNGFSEYDCERKVKDIIDIDDDTMVRITLVNDLSGNTIRGSTMPVIDMIFLEVDTGTFMKFPTEKFNTAAEEVLKHELDHRRQFKEGLHRTESDEWLEKNVSFPTRAH